MIFEVRNNEQIGIVESLAKEIWIEHYTSIIGKDQVEYMLDKFQSGAAISDQISMQGFMYFLIEERGEQIGYIGVQPSGSDLFLSKIYVRAAHRGKGFGRKALQFVEALAGRLHLTKISLTVNKNNIETIKAYEKMGFKNRGPIVQEIGNGFLMDDFRMEKTL